MNINLISVCVAIVILIGGLFVMHHMTVKSEDNKIQAQTASTFLKVENEKSKIRNTPVSDKHTIIRLLNGSF